MKAWLELQLSGFSLITYLLHYTSSFTSPLMKMIWCIFRVFLVLEEESLWTLSELFLFSSIILTSSEGYICDKYSELCIWFTLADMSSQNPDPSPVSNSVTYLNIKNHSTYGYQDAVRLSRFSETFCPSLFHPSFSLFLLLFSLFEVESAETRVCLE